jgi:hypothetical protein
VNARPTPPNNVGRWLPVGAAGGLLAAVIVAGVVTGGGNANVASGTGSTFPVPVASGVVALQPTPPETYNAVDEVPVAVTVPKIALTRTLAFGHAGDDIQLVQQRLTDLAFDPGPVDGIYGTKTKEAVWAFEKLVMAVPRSDATGKVTPEMWDRMQDSIKVKPRRTSGGLADHTEIYLPEQVMVVFHADEPALVTHVSSGQLDGNGDPFRYCQTISLDTDSQGNLLEERIDKAICGFAKTPPGVFAAERKIAGKRDGPLGSMQNPIYINFGIAIHGADNVPLEPASHGCIRVPQHIGSYLQTILELGDKVLIWDGVKEPEEQSDKDMLPVFDFRDPDATTTTTSTTTTTLAPVVTPPPTTPETNPPATTVAATTTVAPNTTTTLAPETTTTTTEAPDDS